MARLATLVVFCSLARFGELIVFLDLARLRIMVAFRHLARFAPLVVFDPLARLARMVAFPSLAMPTLHTSRVTSICLSQTALCFLRLDTPPGRMRGAELIDRHFGVSGPNDVLHAGAWALPSGVNKRPIDPPNHPVARQVRRAVWCATNLHCCPHGAAGIVTGRVWLIAVE